MTLTYFQITTLIVGTIIFSKLIEFLISRIVNPKNHPRIPSTEKALDIITAKGYQAYLWLPGTKRHTDKKMFDALEVLKHNGYIVIDEKRIAWN